MTEQAERAGSMTEVGRIAGVFWAPRRVFEDLAECPRWWAPLIILTVLSIGEFVTLTHVVGWEHIMPKEVELQFLPVMGYVNAVCGQTISALLTAAVMVGSLNWLGGAKLKYRQAFSVTCYSSLPRVLETGLGIVVMFLKTPAEFSAASARPVNLGVFLNPKTTPMWLYMLASSFDPFFMWVLLLMAVGFSIASKKLTFGKSLTLVVLPWAVFVLLVCVMMAIIMYGTPLLQG